MVVGEISRAVRSDLEKLRALFWPFQLEFGMRLRIGESSSCDARLLEWGRVSPLHRSSSAYCQGRYPKRLRPEILQSCQGSALRLHELLPGVVVLGV